MVKNVSTRGVFFIINIENCHSAARSCLIGIGSGSGSRSFCRRASGWMLSLVCHDAECAAEGRLCRTLGDLGVDLWGMRYVANWRDRGV